MNLFDKNQCMGCGNCIPFCPKHLLKLSENLNERNVHYIEITDENACLHCGQCELMCTAKAIKIDHSSMVSGYNLIDEKAIPPHAGCYLGSLTKALADCLYKMNISEKTVIFKKKTADVNLKIETHDYPDESFYEDALVYKQNNPDKVVILICSSSKKPSVERNRNRYLNLTNENITIINTLNWFECENDFTGKAKGGCHMLEETAKLKKGAFLARGSIKSIKDMIQLERYLMKALNKQIENKGYSIVEIVFPCFYRLAGRPQKLMEKDEICKINDWFEKFVIEDYPDGILYER